MLISVLYVLTSDVWGLEFRLETGMCELVQWREAEHVERIGCSRMDTKFI